MAATWWFILPVALFLVFQALWLFYIQSLYGKSISWMLLEVKIAKNIETTPKAMETVFASISAIDVHGITFFEKWWKGEVQNKISFELVGYAGGVYFYVYTPVNFRNLVEASIYAQYPDAEIKPAEDYTKLMPASLPNATYDLYGVDLVLVRDEAYPILMYEHFEDKEDERRLDPIAGLMEAMSKLKAGEMMWIQMILEPAPEDWKKNGELVVQKLLGLELTKKPGIFSYILEALNNIVSSISFSTDPATPPVRELARDPVSKINSMTKGQKDVVEAIEHKLSKLGFKTTIRFIYIDEREHFSRVNVAAVSGAYSQFSTMHLNGFKPHKPTMTKAKGLFKQSRLLKKKANLFMFYKTREFSEKTYVLNIEELATIYHFPAMFVGAPKLQRIEAKKSEPPANLPIG